MEENFDDFEDDFDNDDFMDEDEYDADMEEDDPFAGDTEPDEDPDDAESKNDFTTKDALLAGSFASWACEEGFEKGRRRRLLKEQSKRWKRKKISDDSE